MAGKKSANSEQFSWAQDGGKLLKRYISEFQSDNIFLDIANRRKHRNSALLVSSAWICEGEKKAILLPWDVLQNGKDYSSRKSMEGRKRERVWVETNQRRACPPVKNCH